MSKKKASRQAATKRTFYVLTFLVGVLTLTGGLLVATAPSPLRPEGALAAATMESADVSGFLGQTGTPIRTDRWKYIYLHHSRTPDGNAPIGDHFLIANGNGAPDGRVIPGKRWIDQAPALPPAGSSSIDPDCLSIGLVGDFDYGAPTPAQLKQLGHLVRSLQSQLHLPAHCVVMVSQPRSAAAVGRHFPLDDYRTMALR